MIYNFFKGTGVIFVLFLATWSAGCSGSGSSNTPETVLKSGNPEFVLSVFPTDESWANLFAIAVSNPNCTGKNTLSRERFLSAVADFPEFCGSDSVETNKQELAAFLANVSLETNGAAVGGMGGGLCFDSDYGHKPGQNV